ncbi:DNA primase [Candidatus Woesearchaeota archaeon]|jgi:DNA primase|nr:DNA primase [Candidatus Woesearchaeota archaeon]MBT5271861.1 DNA primase [Candidatus Woesearchaeota archaeon]MBT6041675.1 DNA primase [Candidatus Woesearchaeota archaeon]MBT6337349.1 DNA primase [Candidatus Woesearchaeota archaeon]MBT7927597.1 DNA primase [Candidatus Woesearchaeota archaeon]
MGKISPVSAKYIVHATINIGGVVDRPDVIGAIFGQTEGLLGADLELRELQRSGRIGRIEVNVETKTGKTLGTIIIPSSLDKAETAIVGAALEVIQRIGPCNAKIRVEKIEDVRVSKRQFVVERAKELLKHLMDTSMPDSQELADEVAYSVRVMEITEYGKERLPAGPSIDDSDEVLIVEGRADVLNLLKHGFKNAIAVNGTSVPQTIVELSKKKILTAFVDGDRGGDLIIKELTSIAEIDFVTKAPDGKEVEELTKKEIHKAIRSKVSPEQAKVDTVREDRRSTEKAERPVENKRFERRPPQRSYQQSSRPQPSAAKATPVKATADEKKKFSKLLEDLIGTRGAYVLDNKLNILGKVPLSELTTTLKSLGSGIYAVVFDGEIDANILSIAEKSGVKFLVAMGAKAKSSNSVCVLTVDDF